MAQDSALLTIEEGAIEVEEDLKKHRFLQRLTLLWFLASVLVVAGLLVLVNVVVTFEAPKRGEGGGQGLANVMTVLFGGASTVAAAVNWYRMRSKIDDLVVEQRKLEARRRLALAAQDDARSIPNAFSEYRESIPLVRDEYRRSADRYRSRHNRFQLTVIVGSILTSVATTAAAEEGIWSWLAVSTSALVSISAGIISYYKFRERSLNLQQTADAIDLELQAYRLGIRRYKGVPPAEASATFAEEVERLREEQRKKELQLEQPPEISPDVHSSPSQGRPAQI
ncbi:DUF4231 domain-containing protein [Streptomyces daliensis]|uniref:DUF4231 domain-containing protein n=1 Tax=Streptomyces daliensis TaxID=299421 RepID=A0A8T4IUC2_9ACTN|nr:DUF4231 domain-containing protein [Streptomyces daliensis]